MNSCSALGLTASLLFAACAASPRWQQSFKQTCKANSGPRICFIAVPDGLWTLTAKQVRLTPGECADASGHGGFLRIAIKNGHNGQTQTRLVFVRRGQEVAIHPNNLVKHNPCKG